MIHCLMMSGISLTNSVRSILFDLAVKMVHESKDEVKIVHDDCDGYVETAWDTANIGFISGLVFHADIMTAKGNSKVSYIVRTSDLENIDFSQGKWFGVEDYLKAVDAAMKRASKYTDN